MALRLAVASALASGSALKGKGPAVARAAAAATELRAFSTSACSSSETQPPSRHPSFNSCGPAPVSVSSGPLPSERLETTAEALALLRGQPSHYVLASLAGRTLLLSPADLFTLPRLRDVQVGDVLELTRIHEVGSRDYTLRAQDSLSTRNRGSVTLNRRHVGGSSELMRPLDGLPLSPESVELAQKGLLRTSTTSWATRLLPSGLAHVGAVLPPSTVTVRAVVVEHTKGAMERIEKKKRRKGYKKTIEHKQPYTRMRVEEIVLGQGENA